MKKKTLTIAIALVLVVALAVGATWAYLKAQTGEVKNTFAVGNVIDNTKFALQEHKVAYNDTKGVYDYVLTEAGENRWQPLTPMTSWFRARRLRRIRLSPLARKRRLRLTFS